MNKYILTSFLLCVFNFVHTQIQLDYLNVSPNPFEKGTIIYYGCSKNDTITITLSHATGQKISTLLASKVKQAGSYYDSLVIANLPNGIYIINIKFGHRNEIEKKITKTTFKSTFFLDFIKSYGALFLSLAAFILSFLAFYKTYLKPFKLIVTSTGRYELAINPGNTAQRLVCLFLSFSNNGSRFGFVENIYVIVNYPDKKRVFLFPTYVDTDGSIDLTRAIKPKIIYPFGSFGIQPKEIVTKNIMFVPYHTATIFSPVEGSYSFDVFVRTSTKNLWRKETSIKVKIPQHSIDVLNNNETQIRLNQINHVSGQNNLTEEIEKEFMDLANSIK